MSSVNFDRKSFSKNISYLGSNNGAKSDDSSSSKRKKTIGGNLESFFSGISEDDEDDNSYQNQGDTGQKSKKERQTFFNLQFFQVLL